MKYVVNVYHKGNNVPVASLEATGLGDAEALERAYDQYLNPGRPEGWAVIEVEYDRA